MPITGEMIMIDSQGIFFERKIEKDQIFKQAGDFSPIPYNPEFWEMMERIVEPHLHGPDCNSSYVGDF